MRSIAMLGAGLAVMAVLATGTGRALALEEAKDEKDKLKACEVSLCSLVTKKAPSAGDFTCSLSKTWSKDKVKEGAAAGKVSWGFGDARCSVDMKLPRAGMVDALKNAESTLQFPEHTVTCLIEREKDVTHVNLKLAPKIVFKNGKAVTAWVNLKDVEGPSTMRGLALSVAKLEDGLGIFHKSLIKAINHQLLEKCPKVAAGG